MLQETVQALTVLSQTIARESGDERIANEMKSSLQTCFDNLHTIEEFLPLTLNRDKILLTHVQKFDEQYEKCHSWLNDGKQLMNRYSIQVPVRRIEEYLEQNRVNLCFSSDVNSKLKFLFLNRISSLNLIRIEQRSMVLAI